MRFTVDEIPLGDRRLKLFVEVPWRIHIAPQEKPEYPELARLAARARERRGIETRPIERARLREEVDLIVKVYNEAWADNWGFLPLTEDEAAAMAESLELVADPPLIRFAYVRGELAAVLGMIPDPNVPLKPRWKPLLDTDLARALRLLLTRRRIRKLRLMFFGIRPPFRKLGGTWSSTTRCWSSPGPGGTGPVRRLCCLRTTTSSCGRRRPWGATATRPGASTRCP